MELIKDEFETTTIRFDRKEIACLMAILQAVTIDYKSLDREVINRTQDEVETVAENFFKLFPLNA